MAFTLSTTAEFGSGPIWKTGLFETDDGETVQVYFYQPSPAEGQYVFGSYVGVLGGTDTGTNDERDAASGVVVTGTQASADEYLAEPTGFSLIWKGTNAGDSASIWAPIPPAGFVACGHVVQSGYSSPDTSSVRCVAYSQAVQIPLGPLVWTQVGGGSPSYDVSVYRVSQLGVIFAVPIDASDTPPVVYVPHNVPGLA